MIRVLKSFFQEIASVGNSLQPCLLLAMRLFWGYQFFQAGYGKIQNLDRITHYFSSLEIPFPEYVAFIVGWIECIGGVFLFFGFVSRLASIPLAMVMASALSIAHREAMLAMFSHPQNFIEQLPFNYLLTTLVVFCFGPGKFSLDFIFQKLFSRTR